MTHRRAALSRSLAACAALLLCAACAGLQSPVEVSAVSGAQKSVSVEASSFAFRPNNLLAQAGSTLDLAVTNSSSMSHNLTVKSPDGTVIASVELPAKGVAHASVPLKAPGVYEFYCDKPMHPSLGMKGRIEAR